VKRFSWSSKVVLLGILCWTNSVHGQLNVNPASVNFGNVQAGASTSQALILSNSSNSDLTVSQATVAGPGLSLRGPSLPLTLKAGQNVAVNVVFAPVSAGNASGSFSVVTSATTIHDRSGKHNLVSTTTTTVFLSGSGSVASPAPSPAPAAAPSPAPAPSPSPAPAVAPPGAMVAYPSSLGFAALQAGTSQTLPATLTNSGGTGVTISQATTTSNSFALNGLSLPTTLAAGHSVTFSVTFAPLSAGSASGSISINSDASNPTLMISLAGTGMALGQLAVTPTSADFGSVTVGTTKTQSGTLIASGASVTLSSASVTDSEFSLSGIAFPVTIPAGQSAPFTLTFVPRASGTAAAALSFVSNAANSAAENLTGTGVAPPQHSVSLSWDPATTVVGYNVYRGSQPGGPYARINPVLNASTSFTDGSVQGGQNYYYVTTSVDSAGAHSSYSNEIHAVIPTP
jgi:hypothetical protein